MHDYVQVKAEIQNKVGKNDVSKTSSSLWVESNITDIIKKRNDYTGGKNK